MWFLNLLPNQIGAAIINRFGLVKDSRWLRLLGVTWPGGQVAWLGRFNLEVKIKMIGSI
jgi:hypothetical protein